MLCALIISYEQGLSLDLLLQSLVPQMEELHKVVVVSTNPKAKKIVHKGVEQVFAGDNPGYGAAINKGLKLLKGAHVLILNDDVLLDPLAVQELKKALSEPGIYQPLILKDDGTIENMGHWLWWDGFNYARCEKSLRQNERSPLVFSGAAFAVHRDTLSVVGPFCEDLIFYGEEVDYALRALRLDHPIKLVLSCKIIHALGGSLGRLNHEKIYLIERNRVRATLNLPLFLQITHPFWTLIRIVLLEQELDKSMKSSAALGIASGIKYRIENSHTLRSKQRFNLRAEIKLVLQLLKNPPSIVDLRRLGASRK